MAFEFLVTSDWHIGSLTNVFADALPKQLIELHKIYGYALENGIKYVIVPGDMTDTTVLKNHEAIELIRFFSYYDDKIETHYISGNHDYHSSNRSSIDLLKHLADEQLFENLHVHIDPSCIKFGGVNVNFVPYPHTERTNKKGNCINFVHMDTEGASDDNGYSAKIRHEFEYGKSDITISGHIHKHQVIKSKRWVFCGNPYQKKFDETSPKGFLHCKTATKNGVLKFSFDFIKSRPEFVLKTVAIKSAKDVELLDKNNNIAYKLEPEDGVLLPSDIGATYNIVAIKNKFVAPAASITSVNSNLRTGLKKFLTNCDLSDVQIKRAITEVKEAIVSHSLM